MFDRQNEIEELEKLADEWMVANFGEDGLHYGDEETIDNLIVCSECGEEAEHYDDGLCELCWYVDTMNAVQYGWPNICR